MAGEVDTVKQRRGRGVKLSTQALKALERKILAEKAKNDGKATRVQKMVRIEKIATDLQLDKRTVQKYYEKVERIQAELSKRDNDLYWQIFVEGLRLLSTPLDDVCEYMAQYVPLLGPTPHSLFEKRPSLKSARKTAHHKSLECFDPAHPDRTVRERQKDPSLKNFVDNNLKESPPGTVGIHTVQVQWQIDHEGDNAINSNYDEVGGTFPIMVLAERKLGLDKKLAFWPYDPDASAETLAKKVKEFLDDIDVSQKVVQLVVGRKGDSLAPTTFDRATLLPHLEGVATVEEDVPTIGATADSAAFRLPGRYKSQDAVHQYLEKRMNDGYRAAKKPREKKTKK